MAIVAGHAGVGRPRTTPRAGGSRYRFPIMRRAPLILICLLALPGCFSYRAGDPRPDAIAVAAASSFDWPERSLDEVRQLHDATPERMNNYTLPDGASLDDIEPETRNKLLGLPPVRVVDNTLTDHGLLRVYDVPPRDDDANPLAAMSPFNTYFAGLITGFEPNAAFNSEWSIRRQSVRVTANDDGTATAEYPPMELPRDLAPLQGIQIRIPDPDEVPAEAKGTIFHFNGLLSTKYERAAINKLRELGWAVVQFDTEATVTGRDYTIKIREAGDAPNDVLRKVYDHNIKHIRETNERAPGTFEEPTYEEFVRNLTEQTKPVKRAGYTVATEDCAQRVGREIARDVDGLIAEHAYAAEAVLDHIKRRRPDLPAPYAIAGFSAGAQVAPAVALRLRDDIHALVLVSPALNVYELSRRSEISNGGINLFARDGFEITDDVCAAIGGHYLAATRLDSIELGRAIADIPTLVIYADDDTWVPTALTELMLSELRTPDRLVHAGDHRTLFFFLRSQMGKVSAWLTEHARPRAGDAATTLSQP